MNTEERVGRERHRQLYRNGDNLPVHLYNDNDVTNHDDVLAIFDKTAAELEEKGE